jgi:hypothetical protein
MATKKAKPASRSKKSSSAKLELDVEIGQGLYGLGKELEEIANQLRKLGELSELEPLSDNVADMARALHALANATALSVIAKHGTEENVQERSQSCRAGLKNSVTVEDQPTFSGLPS